MPPPRRKSQRKSSTQTVEIQDVGPCKKHIKVTVDREDIDGRLRREVQRAGRRRQCGRLPARQGAAQDRRTPLPEGSRRSGQDRSAARQPRTARRGPRHRPAQSPRTSTRPTSNCRSQGPLVYEFEVEVRPQFDLPNYKGLKLQPARPHLHRGRDRAGRTPSADPLRPGRAQAGRQRADWRHDHRRCHVSATATACSSTMKETPVPRQTSSWPSRTASPTRSANRCRGQRRRYAGGGHQAVQRGGRPGAARQDRQGDVRRSRMSKRCVMPELTHEFLHTFGVHSPEQLRELVRRRPATASGIHAAPVGPRTGDRAHHRRRVLGAARKTCCAARPARRWHRALMEMQADGIAEEEIHSRMRLMQQDILESTRAGPEGTFRPSEDRRGREDRRQTRTI